MDKINNFLEKTDLSVKDEIILSLIVFVVCSIIFPLVFKMLKWMYNLVIKNVRKFILKRKAEKNRKIRLANGNLTIGEYMTFTKKNQEELTEMEKRAIEKCKDKLNIRLNMDKILENIDNINND